MTSHFLLELDVAREHQAVSEASDAQSWAMTADAKRTVVAVRK